MEQNNEEVDFYINVQQAKDLGPLFLSFMQENNAVLKDGYLDFLNENAFELTEKICPYPNYCFTLFLIKLEEL